MASIKCNYCGEEAVFKNNSLDVYRKDYGPMYICWNYPQCDSYVGCHKGTDKPLGRMANAELRASKRAAHDAFDPLWRKKGPHRLQRKQAYFWLAEKLGISEQACHIGMFDVETCQRVVKICEERVCSQSIGVYEGD